MNIRRVFSFNFWWLAILIANVWYLSEILAAKQILAYLHPRFIPYSFAALVGLSLIVISQAVQFARNSSAKPRAGLLFFIFPLVVKSLAPYSMSDTAMAQGALMQIVRAPVKTEKSVKPQAPSQALKLSPERFLLRKNNLKQRQRRLAMEVVSKKKEKPERMRAVIGSGGAVKLSSEEEIKQVRFTGSNFLRMVDDLYDRIDFYEGKRVEVTGFIFRRSDFSANQFVVARLFMWCCAADAAPVGPMCKWDKISAFQSGTWVKVTGVIENEFFDDTYFNEKSDIPVIRVEAIEEIEKPDSPYVYKL